jgi:hypothetical protein
VKPSNYLSRVTSAGATYVPQINGLRFLAIMWWAKIFLKTTKWFIVPRAVFARHFLSASLDRRRFRLRRGGFAGAAEALPEFRVPVPLHERPFEQFEQHGARHFAAFARHRLYGGESLTLPVFRALPRNLGQDDRASGDDRFNRRSRLYLPLMNTSPAVPTAGELCP